MTPEEERRFRLIVGDRPPHHYPALSAAKRLLELGVPPDEVTALMLEQLAAADARRRQH